MSNWYMLTLVGNDSIGIVAKVSKALYENNCNLGETSMLRLGGNFSIMMMVSSDADESTLQAMLSNTCDELGLHLHIDKIDGRLHSHLVPNVLITVSGADRLGIIAQVTGKLFEMGADILNLESDVAGSSDSPIYIMTIEAVADQDDEAIAQALQELNSENIDIHVSAIDTLVG